MGTAAGGFLGSRGMTQNHSTHGPSETPGNGTTAGKSIAIVGTGIVGASAALALKRAGFDVILYSERTREELRDAVPATGTAILFGNSREHDARIEADRYGADAAFATSAVTVNGGPTFDAPYEYEAQSVDVRLRADDRIGRFLDEGGTFAHRRVDDAELDAIAGDPIAGQGAQLGAIQVAALADALRAETGEWEEELFTRLFGAHWEGHGKPSIEATSLFLGEPKYAEVVGAFFGRAAENPAAGTALFDLLSVPGPALRLRGESGVDTFVRTFEERADAVPAASAQVPAPIHA